MTNIFRYIFVFTLIFALYHTVRDILQIVGAGHWFVNILAIQKHNWCKPFCDYYTFPWEIFVIIGSIIVLRRDRSGILGQAVMFAFIIWPIVWILNWLLG